MERERKGGRRGEGSYNNVYLGWIPGRVDSVRFTSNRKQCSFLFPICCMRILFDPFTSLSSTSTEVSNVST